MTNSELLARSQRAFYNGHYVLAHYLVMAAMYLAYTEGLPRGVLRARFHAAQHAGVLSDMGAARPRMLRPVGHHEAAT